MIIIIIIIATRPPELCAGEQPDEKLQINEGQVENAEVRKPKPKYGNRSMEVRKKKPAISV